MQLRAPGPVAFTGIVVALSPDVCAVSPADARFNHEKVGEVLAEVLSQAEGKTVSTQQITWQVDGELLLVTFIDAEGHDAISSKSLSQTLMVQALNPNSPLRTKRIGTPLREASATRFSERDIATFALSNMAQEQQRLVDEMAAETRALQQALNVDVDRTSGERRKAPNGRSWVDEDELAGSRLNELREKTKRQAKERDAVIANLEEVLQRSSCSQTQSQRSYSRQSPTPEPNLNLSGTSLPPTLLAQNSPDALFLQSLSARQSNSPSESDRNSRMHEALVNASPGTSTWQRNLQNANPTWQPSPNRREFEYNSTVDTYYALRTGNSSSQFSEDSNRLSAWNMQETKHTHDEEEILQRVNARVSRLLNALDSVPSQRSRTPRHDSDVKLGCKVSSSFTGAGYC